MWEFAFAETKISRDPPSAIDIDKNIPIINLINPNNLITDGFYALYYYNTFNRYIRDICCLGVFIIVCLFISFRTLRREQYDYI